MENALTFDIEADELEIFLADVNEHLQAMETGILRLERAVDPDTFNSVFRAAHTLKALAGTVGHHPMAELTHTLETLFDTMREAQSPPAQGVTDELLDTVDTLKALRDEIVARQPSGIDVADRLARLRALVESNEGSKVVQAAPVSAPRQLTSEQATQARSYQEEGYTILNVEVIAMADAFAPAARLLQAVMALMEVGQIVIQHPSLADLSTNQGDHRLWLALATEADVGAVEGVLSDVSDLAEFRVQPFGEPSTQPVDGPSTPRQSPGPDPASAQPPSHPATQRRPDGPPEPVEGPVEGPSSHPAQPLNKLGGGPGKGRSTGNGRGAGGIDPGLDKTVRISVERLDTLMNLVGELVTDRTRVLQIEDALREQYGRAESVGALGEMTAHFGRVVEQLQEEVMRARMLPIAHLFNKFPRLVRDVARTAGKQVDLVIEGEATELDRSIIEAIGDPLIHLLRNAVDHGVESTEERVAAGKPSTGTVRLTAAPMEGQIVITVEDDGGGIDPARVRQAAVRRGMLSEDEAAQLDDDEAIDLIFRPNLSTAKQVTEVSGRGVGMDVVRTNVERLSGSVLVESELGRGTTFRVTLPLTLAIVQTMLVAVRDSIYAIPLAGIAESLYLADVSVSTVKGSPVIHWRESVLPLLDLRQIFDCGFLNRNRLRALRPGSVQVADCERTNPKSEIRNPKSAVVTVAWGKLRAGLVVDKIIGKQEIVVKSFSPIIGKAPGLSGCAILGDASIVLIVDIPSLINAALQTRRQGVVA
ncbi:MAG: chemotaxis protein CheW [Anaerolineae bacterium]